MSRPLHNLMVFACVLALTASVTMMPGMVSPVFARQDATASLQEANKLYNEKSYALAIDAYQLYLATQPPKDDTRAEAEFRLMVALGEVQRWDEAIVASDAFLAGHANESLLLIRALRWRAELLLRRIPHDAWKTGETIYRGYDRPTVASDEAAAQLTRINLHSADLTEAIRSLEQAIAELRSVSTAKRGAQKKLEEGVLYDLLATWETYSEVWGSDSDWKRAKQTKSWAVDAATPYQPKELFPRRVLWTIARLRDLAKGNADDSLAVELRWIDVIGWYSQWETGNGPLPFAKLGNDVIASGNRFDVLRQNAARHYHTAKAAPKILMDLAQSAEEYREVVKLFPQTPYAKSAQLALYKMAKDAELQRWYEKQPRVYLQQTGMNGLNSHDWERSSSFLLPGATAYVRLTTKNVSKVRFTLYRMPTETLASNQNLKNGEVKFTDISEQYGGLLSAVQKGKPIRSWSHETGAAPGLELPREVRVPLSESGLFLLVAASPDGRQQAAVPLLVSDLTLIQKTVSGKVIYLAVNALTGKPVANVAVWAKDYETRELKGAKGKTYWKTFARVRQAKTDSSGACSFPKLPDQYTVDLLARTSGDRIAVLTARDDYGYYSEEANHQHAYRTFEYGSWRHSPGSISSEDSPEQTATGDVRGVAYTDRPLYRPGHTVSYRAILVKQGESANYQPLTNQKVTVTVEDPSGDNVLTETKTVNRYGTINGTFTLGRGAKLGYYQMSVTQKDREDAHGSFKVEEYRKPEFVVTATPSQSRVAPGKTVLVAISAMRYDGTPVANAKVSYEIPRRWYVPAARWDWWQERFSLGEGVNGNETSLTGEATTNDQGKAGIRFSTDVPAKAPRTGALWQEFAVNVRVTDAANREISGSTQVEAVRPGIVVGISPQEWYATAGQKTPVWVQGFTATGEPIAVTGKITVRAQDKKGKPTGSPRKSVVVQTSAKGKVAVSVPIPAKAAPYTLSFTAFDARKHSASAATSLYAYASDGTSSPVAEAGAKPEPLTLSTNKASYAPGETARIVLRSTVPNTTVLLTWENDTKILRREWLTLQGTTATLTLPITRDHAPNLLVAAVGMQNGKLIAAETELRVPPVWSAARIVVTGDKQDYKPGETGVFQVQATDKDGRPVAAEVSLGAIDASLYALEEDRTPNLYRTFYNRLRDMSISLADSNDVYFPPFDIGNPLEGANGRSVAAKAAGSGMGGSGSASASAQVRADFRDTAAWFPAIVTDAKTGKATVKVTFPDSLTTWRATARGVTENVAVGETITEVRTRKLLTARIYTPRFAVERDSFAVTALVRNDLSSEKQVQVRLETDGGIASAENGFVTKTLTLAPGTETSVTWDVRADAAGAASLRVFAETDEESDAVQTTLPILAYGVQKFAFASGRMDKDAGTASINLALPATHKPDSAVLLVRATPGLATGVLDALPYLADYPYGCAEQTMSRFLPSVIVAQTLTKTGVALTDLRKRAELLAARAAEPSRFGQVTATNADTDQTGYTYPSGKPGTLRIPALAAEMYHTERWKNPVFDETTLRKMCDEGLARLLTMRKDDGGFGWWPDSPESDLYMTAYVVYGLAEAKQAGLEVSEKLVDEGQSLGDILTGAGSYLQAQLQKKRPEINETAWALFALSYRFDKDSFPKEMTAILQDVYAHRDKLTPYGLALLALTLERTGDHERASVLARNLRNVIRIDKVNGTAYLFNDRNSYGWWYWYRNDVETTAWILRAFLAIQPDETTVPLLAEWLLQNRRGSAWSSTKETAIVVYALSEYMEHTGDSNPNFDVTIALGDKIKRTIHWTPETALFADDSFLVPTELVTGGDQAITISKTGGGTVRYSAALQYITQDETIAGGGNGVTVVRRYYRGQGTTRTALKEGDTLKPGDRITVELTVTAKNDYTYVLLEDMKPAGCEPTEQRSGFAWGDGLWATCEKRDTKTAFFVERLPQGTHALSYELRAETPGTFHALPVNAYAMYTPEVRAISANATVILKP